MNIPPILSHPVWFTSGKIAKKIVSYDHITHHLTYGNFMDSKLKKSLEEAKITKVYLVRIRPDELRIKLFYIPKGSVTNQQGTTSPLVWGSDSQVGYHRCRDWVKTPTGQSQYSNPYGPWSLTYMKGGWRTGRLEHQEAKDFVELVKWIEEVMVDEELITP